MAAFVVSSSGVIMSIRELNWKFDQSDTGASFKQKIGRRQVEIRGGGFFLETSSQFRVLALILSR